MGCSYYTGSKMKNFKLYGYQSADENTNFYKTRKINHNIKEGNRKTKTQEHTKNDQLSTSSICFYCSFC